MHLQAASLVWLSGLTLWCALVPPWLMGSGPELRSGLPGKRLPVWMTQCPLVRILQPGHLHHDVNHEVRRDQYAGRVRPYWERSSPSTPPKVFSERYCRDELSLPIIIILLNLCDTTSSSVGLLF